MWLIVLSPQADLRIPSFNSGIENLTIKVCLSHIEAVLMDNDNDNARAIPVKKVGYIWGC